MSFGPLMEQLKRKLAPPNCTDSGIVPSSNQMPGISAYSPGCTVSQIVPSSNTKPLIDGEGRNLPTAEDLDAHCEQMGQHRSSASAWLRTHNPVTQEDSDAIREQGGCA